MLICNKFQFRKSSNFFFNWQQNPSSMWLKHLFTCVAEKMKNKKQLNHFQTRWSLSINTMNASNRVYSYSVRIFRTNIHNLISKHRRKKQKQSYILNAHVSYTQSFRDTCYSVGCVHLFVFIQWHAIYWSDV